MAWKRVYATASGEKRYLVEWRPDPSNPRKTSSKTFHRSKDADAFKLEIERREQLGSLYQEEPETFAEFAGLTWLNDKVELTGSGWFGRYQHSVRPSSFQRRKDIRKHLAPFMDVRLDRLNPALVEDEVSSVAAEHPRTAKFLLETVKMVVRAAHVRGQQIDERVLSIKAPKYEPKAHHYLTPRELDELADASSEPHLLRFAAHTGLRPGEIIALRPEDISGGAVHVTRTLYEGVIGPPKRKASVRSVPLTPEARQAVRAQLLRREPGAEYIFCAPWGGPWSNYSNLNRKFRRWCVAAGLGTVDAEGRNYSGPTPHSLRHTFASWAIRLGVDPKELQVLMGHEGIEITMNTYGHLFPGAKESAMARFANLAEVFDADSAAESLRSSGESL